MGFTPQVVDINGDGIADIISGEYSGKITLYKGTKSGYEPPVQIDEELNRLEKIPYYDNKFTNPTFTDINGDGLLDAVMGGYKGMCYMLNEGTKTEPYFGKRELFLGLDGQRIRINDKVYNSTIYKGKVSDYKTYVNLIDWDNDGIKDVVAVAGETVNCIEPKIYFFKGVETEEGLRFGKRELLFTTKDGTNVIMPGIRYMVPCFYDVNQDGIIDLVLGLRLLRSNKTGALMDKWVRGETEAKASLVIMYGKKQF